MIFALTTRRILLSPAQHGSTSERSAGLPIRYPVRPGREQRTGHGVSADRSEVELLKFKKLANLFLSWRAFFMGILLLAFSWLMKSQRRRCPDPRRGPPGLAEGYLLASPRGAGSELSEPTERVFLIYLCFLITACLPVGRGKMPSPQVAKSGGDGIKCEL